jgi:hypothetical protein
MRIFYFAIACIAGVAGVSAIQADVVGSGPARNNPFAAAPTIPRDVILAPNGLPIQRRDAVRLAQIARPVSTGNPSVAPLKWVGMLINPTPTQSSPNAVVECTGQFIKPNVVLTAGHCLKDLPGNPTGPWYDLTKQYFILQYQNGEGSHTFKTKCGAASPQWTYPANYKTMTADQQNIAFLTAAQHDFAMILVDDNSPTGVMPYLLDWKSNWTGSTRVGYAGDILDGKIVQQSHGIVFFADAIPMFSQSFPNLVVHWQSITDLTNGTSGGAWITNFNTNEGANQNNLIAVTSFSNASFPGAEMAAYLTAAEFNPLLTFVSNGCK